ncbi:hypothetical protein VNI00_019269 [Paramarasmius palmivorus]|uniref:Uncharacterized protein n=1 Tax=Paramarasmius palmivorus TaxID=297713 RepID=A0AAW0ANQ5_9AGAR
MLNCLPQDFAFYVSYSFLTLEGAGLVSYMIYSWPTEPDGIQKGMALSGLLAGLTLLLGGIILIIDLHTPLSQHFHPAAAVFSLVGVSSIINGVYSVVSGHNFNKIGLSYDDVAPLYGIGIVQCAIGIFLLYVSDRIADGVISKLLALSRLKNIIQNRVLPQLYFPIFSGAFAIAGAMLGTSKYATLFNILAGVSALLAVLTSTIVKDMLQKMRGSNSHGDATLSLPHHALPASGATDESEKTIPPSASACK